MRGQKSYKIWFGLYFFNNFKCIILFFLKTKGTGPDAFFYVGKFGTYPNQANSKGFQVPYPENQSGEKLKAFNGETIQIKLPNSLKTKEIGWLSVWCRQFSVDFGNVPFFMDSQNKPNKENEVENEAESSAESGAESSAESENAADFINSHNIIVTLIINLLTVLINAWSRTEFLMFKMGIKWSFAERKVSRSEAKKFNNFDRKSNI